MRYLSIVVVLAMAGLICACQEDPPPIQGLGDACSEQIPCPGALVCRDGHCAQSGSKTLGASCTASLECMAWLECIQGVCAEPDPTLENSCTDIACNPPPCCGDSCASDGDCCRGTVCGEERCIPEECSYCESGICNIDFDTCAGDCVPPDCCLEVCTEDADCCPGTSCRDARSGGRKCFPTECDHCDGSTPICTVSGSCEVTCDPPNCCLELCTEDSDCCSGTYCSLMSDGSHNCVPDACQNACGGMTPMCQIWSSCEWECRAPTSCGDDCTEDADCGGSSRCNEFTSGARRCVPEAFDAACGACSHDCTFYPDSCTVECAVPDPCCDQGCTIGGNDCCPGTTCSSTSQGPLCAPEDCRYCGGMTPMCSFSADCKYECVPPTACGDPCEDDSVCGNGSHCETFLSGNRFCVPDGFGDECSACGEQCWFRIADCEVRCEPDEPDPNNCTACCEGCTEDRECCPGNVCVSRDTGGSLCLPEECRQCGYGCTYNCPE